MCLFLLLNLYIYKYKVHLLNNSVHFICKKLTYLIPYEYKIFKSYFLLIRFKSKLTFTGI